VKACIAAFIFLVSSYSLAADGVVPNKLIQLILDSDKLEPFWHSDLKGRVPLNIIHNNVGSANGISKFGKDVVLISSPNSSPYFEIDGFSIKNDIWHVKVSYKIEGVIGRFTAKKLPNGTWTLVSARVVET